VPSTPHPDAATRAARSERSARRGLGGTQGNELLTSATAAVLIALVAAEGVTLLDLRSLVDEHMLIGLMLIPPLLLKLVGYRLVRYYARTPRYVAKGPPRLALRLLAPLLVAATIALLTSGVLMLADGHRSRALLQLHQLSAIAWASVFAVHLAAYAPRVAGSLWAALRATRGSAVPGGGARGLLVTAAAGSGVTLAVALLPAIRAWSG
jgi:hypothetical protein